ncbi:peroxisomal membrane protein PMP34 [Anoplophora glabripennis]|nr:peroxisomal membrane protein PMP34 [Anoplophora glabripennis]XP_018566097.1 peroxisomal membrane protein PMP34 [Anoplophora glabripennis]
MKNLLNYKSLVHATAGATGSVVALTCLYPLDNVKFRIQANDKELVDKSTIQAILHVIRKEGIESLYRGIKPVITSAGISNFVYFYTFHGLKSLLPKYVEINAKTDLVISTIAGVVNVLLTTPLWVVNSRLKLPQEVLYNGLIDGLVHVAKVEGLQGLWKGIGPSLILVSNPVIHFTVYESLKRKVTLNSATAFFLLGALSKTVATVLTYPLQLAQTRQRLYVNKKINTATLLFLVVKNNGLKGLYQGLESKMLQTVLSAALMFMTYEKIAQTVFRLLLKDKHRK